MNSIDLDKENSNASSIAPPPVLMSVAARAQKPPKGGRYVGEDRNKCSPVTEVTEGHDETASGGDVLDSFG